MLHRDNGKLIWMNLRDHTGDVQIAVSQRDCQDQGFPLAKLLNEVEPTSAAKYVRFETVQDRENMPGLNSSLFPWPYVEGLRLDEAMNDLAILSTGLYGEARLPQNGAPIRRVVPWK